MSRRTLLGIAVALGLVALLTLLMLPLRAHLSVATAGLVLVIPVVVGVAVGGFLAGVAGVLAGFLAYDVVFIPPYGTLAVGAAQNWVALVVYVVAMLVVSRLVSNLDRARSVARQREADALRLLDLSDRLIGDAGLQELLERVVSTIAEAFDVDGVALLLPSAEGAEVAAARGEALTGAQLSALSGGAATPTPIAFASGRDSETAPALPGVSVIGMSVSGRPVGMLALLGARLTTGERDTMRAIANHAALAIERTKLREQVLRTQLLEEVDKWRRALMGAVSHDLRTPLASIKASVSDLRAEALQLSESDRSELLELVETQTDRLDRLVTNLLDMTRIDAGTLVLRKEPATLSDLVDEALASLGPIAGSEHVKRDLDDTPLVDVDHQLVSQVLANLIDNAIRHSPEGAEVIVQGTIRGDVVEVAVSDRGPGIDAGDRDRVFEMYNRVSGGGRAGLGLAIVKAFVEAHGQSVRVEDSPAGGARFVFTIPAAATPADSGAA
ncbi:MAG TPA: ATP-binding protein [Acidimicrobiales bacterium]|nr:ATP-binding protein [Acidimicrobiales bacterium]